MVVSAADDWSLSSVVWIFSVAIVALGLAASIAGKWLRGSRTSMCWCYSCIFVGWWFYSWFFRNCNSSALASLPWIWSFGGCGLGLGYVSPVSTLIRWFPDRRGMATGMAIMGFGGGAMIGAPLKAYLLKLFYEAPEYLGSVDSVNVITEGAVDLLRLLLKR